MNGLCLLSLDKYSEKISRINTDLLKNAHKTMIKEMVLDFIATIKHDEPPLPNMDDVEIFKFYFLLYNKEYKYCYIIS